MKQLRVQYWGVPFLLCGLFRIGIFEEETLESKPEEMESNSGDNQWKCLLGRDISTWRYSKGEKKHTAVENINITFITTE